MASITTVTPVEPLAGRERDACVHGTREVADIRESSRVALVIVRDGGASVRVEDDADILSGPERETCGRADLAQFPGSRVLDVLDRPSGDLAGLCR